MTLNNVYGLLLDFRDLHLEDIWVWNIWEKEKRKNGFQNFFWGPDEVYNLKKFSKNVLKF